MVHAEVFIHEEFVFMSHSHPGHWNIFLENVGGGLVYIFYVKTYSVENETIQIELWKFIYYCKHTQ